MVVGLAVFRPLGEADMLQYLAPQQRHVREYWEHVFGQSVDLLYFVFSDACLLANPAGVRVEGERMSLGNPINSLVFKLTNFSFERLLGESTTEDGRVVADVIQRWKAEHPAVPDSPRRVAAMPAMHALLCVVKKWPGYALPVHALKRHGGLGLHSVAATARSVSANNGGAAAADVDLGASQFQHLADSLRVWAPSIAAGGHS